MKIIYCFWGGGLQKLLQFAHISSEDAQEKYLQ